MTDTIEWNLSPCDVPLVATLRYAPFLFFGGYFGLVVLAGVLAAPALARNPTALALVVLFVLVGGPFSLLYLWPMVRDPDQRPGLGQFGWIASLHPLRAALVAITGTVVVLAGIPALGGRTVYLLLFLCVLVPLPVVTLFDGRGRVDERAGTLTFQERTVGVAGLAGVRRYRSDAVTVCWLSYVDGAGGIGSPYLVAFPNAVADEVLALLEDGVAADPDVTPRRTDRTARAVLGATALLFLGAAAAALLFLDGSARVFVAVVTGALGVLFVVGAYYVA